MNKSGNSNYGAGRTYEKLCRAIDKRKINSSRTDDELTVECFTFNDDHTVKHCVIFTVVPNVALIRVVTSLEIYVPDEKIDVISVAIGMINSRLYNGMFDLQLGIDNLIFFRMSNSYIDCNPSENLVGYLFDTSCTAVERYGKMFEMILGGKMTLGDLVGELS